ncbi:arylamine N-acetyltransferase 1 [Mycena vitilis]|nr:arylamine N-acetyltransferase 1 [Mycena vitilis]
MAYPAEPYEAKLNRSDATAYLERIKLPSNLQIPKDTSPLHVPEGQWTGASTPIKLGSAFTNMPLGASAFDRIVHENKGAFCFSINATFASFLRYLGFTTSELVGRSFKSLGNDPLTHPDGFKWGSLTHQLLVAGWPDSADRYLIDGAWGPWNLAKPIKLTTDPAGEIIAGLNEFEAYRLVHEELPLSPHMTKPVDNIAGYTLYRRIAPVGTPHAVPITANSPGSTVVWSFGAADFKLYHHFSASHEMAAFTAFWLITRLIPGSNGAHRSMMYAEKVGEGKRAKVYTTGGPEARGSDEGRDVEWVDMETGAVKEYLAKEFGFKF